MSDKYLSFDLSVRPMLSKEQQESKKRDDHFEEDIKNNKI